jgi:hypothetical protein
MAHRTDDSSPTEDNPDTGETSAKRAIPDDIRRRVRQRCGFGCVVCGLPLYEYEHMLGWANVKRHDASEITLLCDQHHREKTVGLLTMDALRKANEQPYNMQQGMSSPYPLHYSGSDCEVWIGSNRLTASIASDFAAIVVDGEYLIGFRFEDGHYLLNVRLFDKGNNCVLLIRDNELVYSAAHWDVEFVGTRLILRTAAREVFLDILFEPPNRIKLERGRLLFNGVEFLIRPDYLLCMNNAMLIRHFIARNNSIGLRFGRDAGGYGSGIAVPLVSRYGIDRRAVLRWVRKQMREQEHSMTIGA